MAWYCAERPIQRHAEDTLNFSDNDDGSAEIRHVPDKNNAENKTV